MQPETINQIGILASISQLLRYVIPITSITIGKHKDKAIITITNTKDNKQHRQHFTI